MKVLVDEDLLSHVEEMSQYLFTKLGELKEKYDIIEEIRGVGLLTGVKMREGFKSAVIGEAVHQKLLLAAAGHEVVRFLPPLNVTEAEIDEGIRRFEAALKTLQDSPESGK